MTERSENVKTRKKLTAILCVSIITAISLFIECDVYFPDKITVYGENQDQLKKSISYTIETSKNTTVYGDYDATVKLFGVVPVKEVSVTVSPELTLAPGGKAVGIKMFTKGLICVGTQKIEDVTGVKYDTGKSLDIKSGDIILTADGKELHTIEELGELVSSSNGKPIVIQVLRDGKKNSKTLTPIKTVDGYKLGLWVRDSTAGIGTVTFVDKDTNQYGALGHPITDVDTGELMPVDKGSITIADIVDVKKGSRGNPGELYGVFDTAGTDIGTIENNTRQGIFGNVYASTNITQNGEIPIALKSEIKTGDAEIYANVDGNKIEKFKVQIQKIIRYAPDDKNMIIKITDQRLLDITGGIVQGMSGSPLVQNGKLVGAVTHVFVNDPTRGYGIFIENMLAESEKIK